MEQNINLLEQAPTSQKYKYASLKNFLLFIIGFNVLLLLFYFINFAIYKKEVSAMEQLTLDKENALKEISALQKKIAQKTPEAPSINLVKSVILPTSTSFVPYLEKLATYTPYGIWLESIKIKQQDNLPNFSITGKSIAASLVPLFINTAEQQKIFGGEKLTTIKLQKDEKLNIVSFTLSSATRNEQ